jgi:hypothetical protein
MASSISPRCNQDHKGNIRQRQRCTLWKAGARPLPEKQRFCIIDFIERLVVVAVGDEPVSAPVSYKTGKIQGNSEI